MLSIVVLFLYIFIFMIYRYSGRNLSLWLIILATIGWTLSIIGLILYIGKLNYYHFIAPYLFIIPNSLWWIISSLNLDMFLIVRFMNIGVILFVYCVLCFSISFTKIIGKDKIIKILLILLIVPVIEVIIYDPSIYKNIYLFLFNREQYIVSFKVFNFIMKLLNYFTTAINISYLIMAMGIFVYSSYLQRGYFFLKNQSVLTLIAMSSIIIPHLMIFSWAPKEMVNISAIAETTKYVRINLSRNRLVYNIFPYVVICVFLVTIFYVFKLRKVEIAYKNRTVQISRNIDAAKISTRVFTHSMKNQLISILGDAEYLQDEYENLPEVRKTAESIIDTVNSTIDRLNELHNHFDIITINLETHALQKPIEDALNGRCKIPAYINIVKSYAESLPLCLMDLEHMTEVICIIINNAVEAIKEKNGIISIKIEKLGSWGVISITDTGIGIDEDNINKIFNPFFSTKPSRLNWGIGLSYVHKIVIAHKGKIIVDSAPGKGTIFKILLPLIH